MFKIDSHVKAPRVKKPKSQRTPDRVTKAIQAHSEAFKRVYGVASNLVYDPATKMIRDAKWGLSATGVSLKRLNELTTMLKARVE